MKHKAEKTPAWLEEYQHCSCTNIAREKSNLLGHCPRHANPQKYAVKLPNVGDADLGYVEA